MSPFQEKSSPEKKLATFLTLLGKSILALLALKVAFTILISLLRVQPVQPHFEETSPVDLILSTVIIAPLLESFLIIGLLWIVSRFTSKQLAMIITAIIFGVLHLAPGVTWVVAIMTTSIGYLFTYYYYVAKSKRVSGYWLIVIIHLISNTLSIIPEIVQFFS